MPEGFVFTDPRGIRRAIEHHLRDPVQLIEFIDTLDLDALYALTDMHEGEVKDRNKLLRILLIYLRQRMEPRARIIYPKLIEQWVYTGHMNYHTPLPYWVQEIMKMEEFYPSKDFHQLRDVLVSYCNYVPEGASTKEYHA
jgi:hypothetical protein